MDKRFPIEDQIAMLGQALKGRVVVPTDPDYDNVRAVVAANFDHHPLALIRVANAADVAAVINFARATDLPLSVRSGGHGGAGNTGGLVIDLRELNGIDIDAEAQTAWAGTGLMAGEVTAAVEKHGLIVGFGDTASVGIGGLTTGGGVGYLVRKYGLTIDSVVAAEVVTAEGEIVIANEIHHPDLFWAVRGGGGNFGVVTRWKYRLHPLPEFTGGPLVLPATPEVVAGFVALADAAPEELSAITYVMTAPPLPFIPEELHGKPVYMCMMAYAGAAADAEKALAPFRALTTPIADLVGPGAYSSMYMPEDPGPPPAFSVRMRFVDRIGVAEARKIIDFVEATDAPFRLGEIRVLGGAFARVPADATAFAHRDARIMLAFIAASGSAEDAIRYDVWAEEAITALTQGDDRVYVNFLTSDRPERTKAAYGGKTWERLARIKRAYDPENLFRLNRNIAPAT